MNSKEAYEAVEQVLLDYPSEAPMWMAEFLESKGLTKEFLESIYGDIGEEG